MNDIFYYNFGLALMALLKLKSLSFGYRKPRPKNLAAAQASVDYVHQVFANFQAHYRNIQGMAPVLAGKAVLEVGPGPDLGTGLLFLLAGAKNYTAVDRFELLDSSAEFYEAFLAGLAPAEKRRLASTVSGVIKSLAAREGNIETTRLKYLNLPVERLADLPNRFDLIFSNAVMEHFDQVELAFAAMHEVLVPGGEMYHEIDLQVHTGLIRERDPLGFLRYPAWLYDFLKPIGHPNRLRAKQFLELAKRTGFKQVKVLTVRKLDGSLVERWLPHFAKPFRDMTAKELEPLSIILVAKK